MKKIIEKNLRVRMRDGVYLSTDVYRPAEGGPFPVLLIRTPYNKEDPQLLSTPPEASRLLEAGYAVVAQDVRGRYASEGVFDPFAQEAADGADTIAWAQSQPWSTGKIGTFGLSYMAMTQWLQAGEQPEGLAAMAPSQVPAGYYEGMEYQGGVFQTHGLVWSLTAVAENALQRQVQQGRITEEAAAGELARLSDFSPWLHRMPLSDIPPLADLAPFYFDWLAHPDYDDYWRALDQRQAPERITVPALHIGGWYDIFQSGTLENYQRMRLYGGSPQARRHQRLIMGPWTHGVFEGSFDERSYGAAASARALDLTGMHLRWFDHWLKGEANGVEQEKPVWLFVMGLDQWRAEDDWPLPDTHYRAYYLHSAGHANTVSGDGLLCPALPDAEAVDVYISDPLNPVPTRGGAMNFDLCGPCDQRSIETREDVLCYTTPPLTAPLEVTGPLALILWVSSSARDTDFTGKLVDVYPDGRAEILTDGILRARYRESLAQPLPLKAGERYELRLDLGATSNVFRVGHRIRLEVASSNFPRFARNTNTGGVVTWDREADCVRATNAVYHGRGYPSRLILPVIERA
ncbi:MAG TPA: CocE/NonD family hydrolase [Ktedonobacteraceae bacterium]|nr:CocE/NonD family hydrolase [Ktedonobacteraceae bacterium]